MRSEEEIRKRIAEIKHDDRMKGKVATIFENAPLALTQLTGERAIKTLKWVLEERGICAPSFPREEK